MPISASMEEKSSIARVNKKFGRFSYHIYDFSSLSTEVGCAVEGPDFELCGHLWQLRLFPGGSLIQHKGHVSLYLASKSDMDARASYRLSILSQLDGGEHRSYSSNGWRLFKAKTDQVDGWGRDKFVRLSDLLHLPNGYYRNDSIVVEVEILVHGNVEHSSNHSMTTRTISQHSLEHAMSYMLNDTDTADIKLVVGPEQHILFTHRFILIARSKVFRSMLASSMYEDSYNNIILPDIDVAVMIEVLRFLYTDIVPAREVMQLLAVQILVVALKYEISLLVDHCELFLTCRIDSTNAVDVLLFADTVNSRKLRNRALYCIAQNAAKILQSKEFQELDEELIQDAYDAINKFGKQSLCTPKFTFVENETNGRKKLHLATSSSSSGCTIM